MIKRCVWATAIGVALAGGAWNSATAQIAYDLTKLKTLCVTVEPLVPDIERHLGLSQESVKNHVYVWLKAKLPRLRIVRYTGKKTAACMPSDSFLVVNVNLGVSTMGERKVGYFGSLVIQLLRSTLWETGNAGVGVAYDHGKIITGPLDTAKHVYNAIDDLLAEFAAHYYEAGNP